jgi:hypothetical protein
MVIIFLYIIRSIIGVSQSCNRELIMETDIGEFYRELISGVDIGNLYRE